MANLASRNVWELALTANAVRVSSIHELYGERMRIYTRLYVLRRHGILLISC